MHPLQVLGVQILAIENRPIRQTTTAIVRLGAHTLCAEPVVQQQVLRDDVTLPFVLGRKGRFAAGKVEHASEGAGVLLLDVGVKVGAVGKVGSVAVGAFEGYRGGSQGVDPAWGGFGEPLLLGRLLLLLLLRLGGPDLGWDALLLDDGSGMVVVVEFGFLGRAVLVFRARVGMAFGGWGEGRLLGRGVAVVVEFPLKGRRVRSRSLDLLLDHGHVLGRTGKTSKVGADGVLVGAHVALGGCVARLKEHALAVVHVVVVVERVHAAVSPSPVARHHARAREPDDGVVSAREVVKLPWHG